MESVYTLHDKVKTIWLGAWQRLFVVLPVAGPAVPKLWCCLIGKSTIRAVQTNTRKEDICSFEKPGCVSFFPFEFGTKLETQLKFLHLICSTPSISRLLVLCMNVFSDRILMYLTFSPWDKDITENNCGSIRSVHVQDLICVPSCQVWPYSSDLDFTKTSVLLCLAHSNLHTIRAYSKSAV